MNKDDSPADECRLNEEAAWISAEITSWLIASANNEDFHWKRLFELNRSAAEFFVFYINNGCVELLEKPKRVGPIKQSDANRAAIYRRFLEQTLAEHDVQLTAFFGMSMNDRGFHSDIPPTIAYQKKVDSKKLLLPDIDLIDHSFFQNKEYLDQVPYEQKRNSAIFAGSTTGTTYTIEIVRSLNAPRLEAAMYFKGHSSIQFLLPKIAQCDSDETAEEIRKLGFGNGELVTWKEQFSNKFLISMDGNGATCQRVAVALRSNCVLLKYDSPYVLYYFRGLTPWVHYIPIHIHSDIERIIAAEAMRPGLFSTIAENGKAFADTHLTAKAAKRYTANLIRQFARTFCNAVAMKDFHSNRVRQATCSDQGNDEANNDCLEYENDNGFSSVQMREDAPILVHVSSIGNITGRLGEWLGRSSGDCLIEGFIIYPIEGMNNAFEYCGILGDGGKSKWKSPGHYCGTVGLNQPLFGVALRVSTEYLCRLYLKCSAKFLMGHEVTDHGTNLELVSHNGAGNYFALQKICIELNLFNQDPARGSEAS